MTATRGERGRFGDGTESPGPEIVGRAREAELRAAARELGVREVALPRLPRRRARSSVDAAEAIGRIAGHLRRVRPQVVDHVRPGRRVWPSRSHRDLPADRGGDRVRRGPGVRPARRRRAHRVSKLYFIAWSREEVGRVSGGAAEARRQGGRRGAAGGAVARLGASPPSSTRAGSGRPCGAPCRATRRR